MNSQPCQKKCPACGKPATTLVDWRGTRVCGSCAQTFEGKMAKRHEEIPAADRPGAWHHMFFVIAVLAFIARVAAPDQVPGDLLWVVALGFWAICQKLESLRRQGW